MVLGSDLVRFRAVSRRLGDRLMGQPARFEGSVSLAQDLGLEAAQDHRGTSRLIYQKITIVRHFSQNADALRFLRVRGSGIAGPGPRSGARARPSRHI